MKYLIIIISTVSFSLYGQEVSGRVYSNGEPLAFANVFIKETSKGAMANENGFYTIKGVETGKFTILVSFTGYKTQRKRVTINEENINIDFHLEESEMLDEVVVTGTLKAVSRLESPVPVEVYTPTFLKKNPTP